MDYYTSSQFALFRVIFGLYLAWHFATLIPYSPELFGYEGMLPYSSLNPTSSFIPYPDHWLFIFESNILIQAFLLILTITSFLFAAGFYRSVCSIILWYGWTYLFLRNNLIANPGIPHVGWLLLVCAVIPQGEGHYLWNPTKKGHPNWHMPEIVYWGAWVLMALGYTISGIHKLQCPSWIDGSALRHVLSSALSRNNLLTELLLEAPHVVLHLSTWLSLAAEISFLPLGLFKKLRLFFWILFMCLHIGILSVINFTDLTLGVLMIHIFTFDHTWFESRHKYYYLIRKAIGLETKKWA